MVVKAGGGMPASWALRRLKLVEIDGPKLWATKLVCKLAEANGLDEGYAREHWIPSKVEWAMDKLRRGTTRDELEKEMWGELPTLVPGREEA